MKHRVFFSQSIWKWNLGFFRSINLEVTGLFLFQSINLEVKPRFDIPWSGWLLTTQMKQLKYLSLKGVLRKTVIMKKNILQPVHLWRRVCGLCWKIFVSVGSFSFLLIPSWKEGEGHPISIVLAMCFQLIEVLNWEHWRSILSNWNLGILNFRSTHFRPYWQISNCPLGNGNQVEVQAQGQMALPTVSDWYFHFTPSTRSEFSTKSIPYIVPR